MIDHLSYSQISMWLRCQKQWQYRYVDRLIIPTAAMLALGSSYHEAHEVNFSQKIETNEDLSEGEVTDSFSDAWERRLDKEEILFVGEEPGVVKDIGIALTKMYHNEISPSIQPIAAEKPFRLEFENAPFALEGRIDVVTEPEIIDLKTAKRSPKLVDGKLMGFDLQSSIYRLADTHLDGGERSHRYDYAIKTKLPKTLIAPVEDQSRWEDFTLSLISDVAEQIKQACETGVFVPNPTHPWACGEDFCGYWSKCMGRGN